MFVCSAVLCSSFISYFPRFMYFLCDSETVPASPVITGITYGFTFHMHCFCIVRSLYFRISQLLSWAHFSPLKLQHLLTRMSLFHHHGLWSPVYCYGLFCQFAPVRCTVRFIVMDCSVSLHLFIAQYGLLLWTVLSVCTCSLHSTVYCYGLFCQFAPVHCTVRLPSPPVSATFGTWSHQRPLSDFTTISLHMLKCGSAHTVSCLFMFCSFASTEHADMMLSIVLSNCLQILYQLSVCRMFCF